jgi:hypothetical protein
MARVDRPSFTDSSLYGARRRRFGVYCVFRDTLARA